MNTCFRLFLRLAADRAGTGTIRDFDGVESAWVNSRLAFHNATYLTAPVASPEDLARRLAIARADAATRGGDWYLFAYEPYLGGLPIGPETGFAPEFRIRTMAADVARLAAPTRPLPAVDCRAVTSADDTRLVLDLNMRAYGLPVEAGASVLAADPRFARDMWQRSFVAWTDGTPVSTATVVKLDDCLYVALVATDPGHRQRGYAEAVMRHALARGAEDFRTTRTVLDATDAGAPLYEQMGYAFTGEIWAAYQPTR